MIQFDRVLGLNLGNWTPVVENIPEEISALAEQRQLARQEKRWQDADSFRQQIAAAGYEIEDTPQGPRIKARKKGI